MLHSPGLSGRVYSYVRMSQTAGKDHWDYRAVCSLHGTCTLTKSGRDDRPIGRLWSWLDAASNFDGPDAAAAHRAYAPTLEQRTAAREEFSVLDGAEEFLENEVGGVGAGEPERTWVARVTS